MIERLSAFETAVINEMIEGQFYQANAVNASNSLIRVLFEWMASEEWKHHNALIKLHAELQTHGKLPDDISFKITKTTIQDFFEDMIKKILV